MRKITEMSFSGNGKTLDLTYASGESVSLYVVSTVDRRSICGRTWILANDEKVGRAVLVGKFDGGPDHEGVVGVVHSNFDVGTFFAEAVVDFGAVWGTRWVLSCPKPLDLGKLVSEDRDED